jgi:hypothetical protein
MSRTRAIFSVLVLVSGIAVALPTPARAQVMPTQGIDIPWFHSPMERAQREACRRSLPECRAATRAQMELEAAITVILPWASLGIAILAGLFWLRAQEKKRERKKKRARMHHTPGAFRKLDREKQTKSDDDEEADRLAF